MLDYLIFFLITAIALCILTIVTRRKPTPVQIPTLEPPFLVVAASKEAVPAFQRVNGNAFFIQNEVYMYVDGQFVKVENPSR